MSDEPLYCYDCRRRIPYRDCNTRGLLRPRHLLDYFKTARVDALRSLGIRYRDLEDRGVLMPVVDAEISCRRPARYDDLLTVRVCFPDDSSVRIPTTYTVFREESDDPLATARVMVCFISAETRRPIRPPEPVRRALRQAAASSEPVAASSAP
jgi:acyl-CoA thioester hydrolase